MNYVIKTFGCQMNFSDSERIMTFMEENGFTKLINKPFLKLKAEEIIKADLIIFNTCGVRASAEHRVFGQVNNLTKLAKKKNKKIKIIITGCSAHRKDFQKTLKNKIDLFISIKDFPQALQKLNLLQQEEQELKDYLSIQPNYQEKNDAVIPIMTGCNNFCSYCVVPYARGQEWSRPIDEIIKEVESLNDKNYKEITLLGQNVNSYTKIFQPKAEQHLADKIKQSKAWLIEHSDSKAIIQDLSRRQAGFNKRTPDKNLITIKFPLLLDILAKQFPKITFKFLTSHPKDLSDNLIQVIKSNTNIPNEIHLPIQAGSDKVLKDMNRPYTQKQYLNLIKKIKKAIPSIKITTDVIIGFPTETANAFLETVKVFKKVRYSKAYLNKYSPRPETPAFKLGDPISWTTKKEREKMLLEILK